jgi:hypothetical protein
MLLPKKYLELISYWEEKSYCSWGFTMKTKVTIHYNAWYKLPKSFVFPWAEINSVGDVITYQEPEEAVELIEQLKQL